MIGAAVAWRMASISAAGSRSPRAVPCRITCAPLEASFWSALPGSTAVPTISISGWPWSAWRTSARPAQAPVMKVLIGDPSVIRGPLHSELWLGVEVMILPLPWMVAMSFCASAAGRPSRIIDSGVSLTIGTSWATASGGRTDSHTWPPRESSAPPRKANLVAFVLRRATSMIV